MTTRGRKPGAAKTGGRAKGTPNKATAEIKDIAQAYGPDAIRMAAILAGLVDEGAGGAESEAARISALQIILDRAYGRPAQTHAGDPEGAPIQHDHRHGLGWMTEAQAKGRGWA